ncbi:MAG: hypothetical protein Q7S08_03925 [bacterium]|nr:hypothetical protein [bacterium]
MAHKPELERKMSEFIRRVDDRAVIFSRQIDDAARALGIESVELKRIVKPLLQALLDKHLGE